jgi:hypothetical protein
MVWSVKAEKVLNPPQKPTTQNNFKEWLSEKPFLMSNPEMSPERKHARMFTPKIPI